jgi:hypothetical protein
MRVTAEMPHDESPYCCIASEGAAVSSVTGWRPMSNPVITVRVELSLAPETIAALEELARAALAMLSSSPKIIGKEHPSPPSVALRVSDDRALPRQEWPAWAIDIMREGFAFGLTRQDMVMQMAARGFQTTAQRISQKACSLGIKRPPVAATAVPTPSQSGPKAVAPVKPSQARANLARRSQPSPPASHQEPTQVQTSAPASVSTARAPSPSVSPFARALAQKPSAPAPMPARMNEKIAPGPDGLVPATFQFVKMWAGKYGVEFDGSNVDAVNRKRRLVGLAPFIVDHTGASA